MAKRKQRAPQKNRKRPPPTKRHKPAAPKKQGQSEAARYRAHRERAGRVQAEQSRRGRDIGSIPPIADSPRRSAAEHSLRLYCETYESSKFPLAWSEDHLTAIARYEDAVLRGDLFALAMARGSGKTTLLEAAVRWAALYGHRLYIVLIGAALAHAVGLLESIKVEFETNDLLLADFPEVCYPIRCLERTANRCKGQTYEGRATYIGWNEKEIVLPTIPGSSASGCCIRACGLTGRLRGMKRTLPDGRTVRPDFVALDDPQTDESAASPSQCEKRIRVLMGAILGLAGPGEKIAGVMLCTVISPNDVADQVLDAEKFPQWHGLRTQMVYAFPTAKALWDEYARIRAEGLRAGEGLAPATAFYKKNRKAMDAGAKVGWPDRHNADELSAVQHAMNLLLQNERAFWAEYQNQPKADQLGRSPLTPAIVVAKANGMARGSIGQACEHVVAYVDVHERLLYYVISAWEKGFGGGVIDYGTYPKQRIPYFTQATAPIAMADVHPGMVEDAWIIAGLTALTGTLLAARYVREDGAEMAISKLLVDVKWGEKNKLLRRFCRRHPQAPTRIFAAQGLGIGAASKPFEDYRDEPGAELGEHWRIPPAKAGERWVTIDTNFWKTTTAKRLAMPKGTPGGWDLFGAPGDHDLFADHCVAEEAVEVTARGRTIDEWKWRPGRPDNHWWDCLVGSAVAGSMVGCVLPGMPRSRRRRRGRIIQAED